MSEKQWQGTTLGSERLLHSLIWLLRHVDVRIVYAFAAIFVVPVTLMVNHGRRFIYQYLRCRQGMSRLKAAWHTYRNFCIFGQVVIDKFAMFAGRKFDMRTEGYEHFKTLASAKDGFVQLSAHIGNYEMAGFSLVSETKRFNALVFGGEKATVMQGRKHLFEHSRIRMISVKPDMSHLFEINDALADGEIMSIPADRIFGSQKAIEVNILGAACHLPMGPFAVAVSRGVEVLAVNVMKTKSRQYTIYVTPLPYDHTLRQREQAQQLANAYAAELERMLRMYPDQWYNYFDFWK